MSRTHEAAAAMQSISEEILTECSRLPAALVYWHPAPEVWSIMDNLCHIREFVPYWTAQVVGIVERSGQLWGRDQTDASRLAAVRDSSAERLADVEAAIRKAVRESVQTLQGLDDTDLDTEAASKNPRWGIKPAGFIVENLLVKHLRDHLGQIRRNVAQSQAASTTSTSTAQ